MSFPTKDSKSIPTAFVFLRFLLFDDENDSKHTPGEEDDVNDVNDDEEAFRVSFLVARLLTLSRAREEEEEEAFKVMVFCVKVVSMVEKKGTLLLLLQSKRVAFFVRRNKKRERCFFFLEKDKKFFLLNKTLNMRGVFLSSSSLFSRTE